MASESGLSSQNTDYARHIQKILNELGQMQQTPRLVTSPEELETLEREMRQRTDRLGSLLVGHHLQQALDSAAVQAIQEQPVSQWPKPLKNDGKVKELIRTAQGLAVPVWVTYYRRRLRSGRRSRRLLLYEAQAPPYQQQGAGEDADRHAEGPNVANGVIEALVCCRFRQSRTNFSRFSVCNSSRATCCTCAFSDRFISGLVSVHWV